MYDAPQTPYQRVLAAAEVSPATKQRLRRQFETLNPVALQRELTRLQQPLLRLIADRDHPAEHAG